MTSFTRRAGTAAALIAAILSMAGCAELPANAGASACSDAGNWFDRQRQLADGQADPYAASADAPCRVSSQGRGIVVVEGARRS